MASFATFDEVYDAYVALYGDEDPVMSKDELMEWMRARDLVPSRTYPVDIDEAFERDMEYLRSFEAEPASKTREEIEELKRQWARDPIWDIADTDGFEGHREELEQFQAKVEREQEREREKADHKMATDFGVRGDGFVDIERFGPRMRTLLMRLESAEEKIHKLEMRVFELEHKI